MSSSSEINQKPHSRWQSQSLAQALHELHLYRRKDTRLSLLFHAASDEKLGGAWNEEWANPKSKMQ